MSLILLTIIAAVVSQILGWAWHGPLFGKKYGNSVGMTNEQMATMKPSMKQMAWPLGLNFIANLAMSFVFFNLLGAFGAFGFGSAFRTMFIVYIGFILPMFTTAILWDGRTPSQQKMHFAISFGYYLVNFAIWAALFALLA